MTDQDDGSCIVAEIAGIQRRWWKRWRRRQKKVGIELYKILFIKKGCTKIFFAQPFFKNDILLFNGHIRSTHVPDTNIFSISFFKQHHIIPGINDILSGVNQFKITNFNYLIAIRRWEYFVRFK